MNETREKRHFGAQSTAGIDRGNLTLTLSDRICESETRLQEVFDMAQGLAGSDLDAMNAKNAIQGLARLVRPVLDDLTAASSEIERIRAADRASLRSVRSEQGPGPSPIEPGAADSDNSQGRAS
jgi:hypothetical protein